MEERTTKANLSLRQNVIDKIMQGKTYAADVSKDLEIAKSSVINNVKQ